jgi:hypothetical protein
MLYQQQAWSLSRFQAMANTDEPEIRVCVMSGPASMIGTFPMHVMQQQPALAAIQQEAESLMKDVIAAAPAATEQTSEASQQSAGASSPNSGKASDAPQKAAKTADQVIVERLALQMVAAIREKNDEALKAMTVDRYKGWGEMLPRFASEVRERFSQRTGKPFAMQPVESLVEGDLAVVRCAPPKELPTDRCLYLSFVKTADGWRNWMARTPRPGTPLAQFLKEKPPATTGQAAFPGTARVHIMSATGSMPDHLARRGDFAFGFGFYGPLIYAQTRRELGLSGEQETRLREIKDQYLAEQSRRRQANREKPPKPGNPTEQQQVAMKKQFEEATSFRRQVDDVLSAEQLAKLKDIMLAEKATIRWMMQAQALEKLGLNNEQQNAFHQDQASLQRDGIEEQRRRERENDAQSLAVLTAQQCGQIEREVAAADAEQAGVFGESCFMLDVSNKNGHVYYPILFKPDVLKELGLSTEQLQTLQDIISYSRASRELYELDRPESMASAKAGPATVSISSSVANPPAAKPHPGWIVASKPERQEQSEKLEKELRDQIRAVFTPEQLAAFKKLSLRIAVARALRKPEALGDLHLTDQQKQSLLRLREDRAWIWPQLNRKVGEELLKRLTPQQRARLVEELDRQQWLSF